MDLYLLMEGAQFTLYSLEIGKSTTEFIEELESAGGFARVVADPEKHQIVLRAAEASGIWLAIEIAHERLLRLEMSLWLASKFGAAT